MHGDASFLRHRANIDALNISLEFGLSFFLLCPQDHSLSTSPCVNTAALTNEHLSLSLRRHAGHMTWKQFYYLTPFFFDRLVNILDGYATLKSAFVPMIQNAHPHTLAVFNFLHDICLKYHRLFVSICRRNMRSFSVK